MNSRIAVGLAALAAAASGSALAQSDWSSPFARGAYIGASGGESRFRTDCASPFTCDRKDTGWKLYMGGRMNEVLGLELGYTGLGKVNANGGEAKAWAGTASLLAGAPIGDRINLFAKGGAAYGRTDVSGIAGPVGTKSSWGATFGGGAAFAVTDAVQVRVDWDRYKLDFVGGRHDVDLLSAGVQLRF